MTCFDARFANELIANDFSWYEADMVIRAVHGAV
jgi:hypothetical protein